MAVGTYFPGRGTMLEKSFLKGVANERSRLILSVLEKRGIPIADDHRARIADCSDLDVLDARWDRALSVGSAEELFIEEYEAGPGA
ncbi:hypothetical protein [Streptomyces qinzhouensis]|uniref:Uncharacterized protein n=1 Tax=Streptomyces qinzhouensis TaxID=2599401 RepID=A0A5B8IIY7_9ACTN|nr:hypothetical protein [Streptomyces qinzhouensis]QDY78518.1 hypothetical protein FQU76_20685 [Streptomyces qinzhouensis]